MWLTVSINPDFGPLMKEVLRIFAGIQPRGQTEDSAGTQGCLTGASFKRHTVMPAKKARPPLFLSSHVAAGIIDSRRQFAKIRTSIES